MIIINKSQGFPLIFKFLNFLIEKLNVMFIFLILNVMFLLNMRELFKIILSNLYLILSSLQMFFIFGILIVLVIKILF